MPRCARYQVAGLADVGVALLVFVANFLRLFAGNTFSFADSGVPAHDLLGLCYAAELYAAYHFLRKAGRWRMSA